MYNNDSKIKNCVIFVIILCTITAAAVRYVNVNSTGGNGTTTAISGTNAAYGSISDAVAATPEPMTESWIIICHAALGDTDKTALTISTRTDNNATNYIEIKSDDAINKYSMQCGSGYAITILAKYARINGVSFDCYSSATAYAIYENSSGVTDIRVFNCIFKTNHGSDAPVKFFGSAEKLSIFNCVFLDTNRTTEGATYLLRGYDAANTVFDIYNCTFFNTPSGSAIYVQTGTVTMKNCLFFRCNREFSGTISDTYCATSSDTGGGLNKVGTGNRFLQNFSFTDTTTYDFNLTTYDTGAKDLAVTDPGSGLFSDDIIGTTRGTSWDIGAYECASSCTPATITRHSTIIDTIFNTGKFGHTTSNPYDSIKLYGTWPDSSALISYTTKDTIAFHWKDGYNKAAYKINIYSCAGVNENSTYDTITILKWAGAYTTKICTLGVAMTQSISSVAYSDSFTFANLPTGLSGNKITGEISGTPSVITSKTAYKVNAWRLGFKQDSTYDTLLVIYGNVILDSISPDSGQWRDTISIYGRAFGITQGSSTILFDSVLSTVALWSNTLLKIIVPNTDTGYVDFVISDGVTTDALYDAFKVLQSLKATINLISPTKGKRNTIINFYTSNLPDSSANMRAKINTVNMSLIKWSNDTVKAVIPIWAPRGYYWPMLDSINGVDTVHMDTASTRYRVLIPEMINGGN